MDSNIFIRQDKTEHYEFQLAVNGLNAEDVTVRFVLQSDPFMLVIPCKREKGDTWSLELPKMPFLESTTYQFNIEAIVDGFYFNAFSGTVTVAKSPEVYVRKDDVQMKLRNRDVTASDTPAPQPAAKSNEEEVAVTPKDNSEEMTADDKATEPVVSDDRFKEILSRIKGAASSETKAEEKTEKAEKKAVKSAEEKTEKAEKKAVKSAEEKTETKASDKKKEKKDDSKKKTIQKDNKKEDVGESGQPADSGISEKKIDHEKVKSIISESHRERQERLERQRLRQQRLAEEHAKKQQAKIEEQQPKTPEPKKVVQLPEAEQKAKAILEAARSKQSEPQQQPKVKFQKGETVVK